MNDSQSVSAIIPVWNGAEFLRAAVCSILAQSHVPDEILIIDDGSTDDSAAVAAEFGSKVSYHLFPHRGLPCAREEGVKLARAELIAFLDVDDLWRGDKTELQLRLVQETPGAALVNGHTQLQRLVESKGDGMRFEDWGAPVLATSFGSALIRREVFGRVGKVPAQLAQTEDIAWFMRARELGLDMLVHPQVVQYYRRHTKNMSNDHELTKRSLLNLLRESLARREADGTGARSLAPLHVTTGQE